ncbi:transposase [Cyanobium sp. Morenito 9A2]|uniref:transposase n=1 Tax=Cyanobium sp. Morenito 9A2 TaxID=2823718 RepID=UPI0029EBAE7D|nr:transposase [Cyanobium sp. Morenito 9A2]
MTYPTKPRCRFTALRKQEAVAFCPQDGLSCSAVARRLGLPSSSLARWVLQARIARDDGGPGTQGLLTIEERAALNRLRQENREHRREKDFQAGGSALCVVRRSSLCGESSCRREVSVDPPSDGPLLRLLAVPAAWGGPQWLLRLAAAAGTPRTQGS